MCHVGGSCDLWGGTCDLCDVTHGSGVGAWSQGEGHTGLGAVLFATGVGSGFISLLPNNRNLISIK